MAAGRGSHRQHSKGRHQRLLFVVEEHRIRDPSYAYLVIRINLKDMFTSVVEEEDWAATMRSLPCPAAELNTKPPRPERFNLAIVPSAGGTNIVAVSFSRRTIIYAAAAAAEVPCVPELRYSMPGGPALIPLGTRLYAVPHFFWPPSRDELPSFQSLLPPAQRGSNGRWSWRALPAPPPDLYKVLSSRGTGPYCFISAFLAVGTRVWISVPDRGTYSFDTARLAWSKEGDWELPFQERGLFVPELGLCFGLCPHRYCLCAFDLPTAGQPPVARYVWQDDSFHHKCLDRGFHLQSPGSLAYLGDGKFCITWTISIEYGENRESARFALLLMAVQVVRASPPREPAAEADRTGELRLLRHKVRCYKMSPHGVYGYVLQPSLG